MTNTRIWSEQADEWKFCPWCGRHLEEDQDTSLIIRNNEGEIDVGASEEKGFNFENSVKHCGFDIRLWVSDEAKIE